MKKITLLLVLVLIVSCSTSDDSGGTPIVETSNYFPLTLNSYWTYNNDNEQGSTRDSLYAASNEVLNGLNYTKLIASDPVSGFMTSMMSQSLMRTTESKLLLNGEFGTPPIEGFPDINIPLIDLIIYDKEAGNGTVLSEVTGEIEEIISEIPISIEYTISTIQGEILEEGTGDFTDNKVLISSIKVNLSISANIEILGTIIQIPILQAQDVIKTTNYFASSVGLIFSESLIEYELEDLSSLGIDLPIPAEASSIAIQNIDTYQIEN
ncbi:MAG: hypothetical protein HN507_04825 [Flavobacteriaceae bacterium]|jgi:hypothetical protein|nr:hypothetical protein [Flavobacteriaceae bacterium]